MKMFSLVLFAVSIISSKEAGPNYEFHPVGAEGALGVFGLIWGQQFRS